MCCDLNNNKVKLPSLKNTPEVLVTDTVGFIQKLPANLVAAFRATLEQVLPVCEQGVVACNGDRAPFFDIWPK